MEKKEGKKQEITIEMIDTPGLGGVDGIKVNETLQGVSNTANKRADIILYCVSMHPASHIDSSDAKIIKQLTSTFGSDIWRRSILCLTFANTCKPEDDEAYKSRVESYAQQFQRALRQANVFEIKVQSVFSATRLENKTTIPVIPVGFDPRKQLPLKLNWSEQLFTEILQNRSDAKFIPTLLETTSILIPAAELGGSITIGTAVGAAIGTAIGLPLFGIGAVPGIAVGAVIGAAVGAVLPTATNNFKNKYLSWKTKRMDQQKVR